MPRKNSMSPFPPENCRFNLREIRARALAGWSRPATLAAVMLTLAASPALSEETEPLFNGLPFTRSYALAEIGDIPRGARLSFDTLGRIAVTNNGSVIVLNDATWMDIAERNPPGESILQYIREIGGTTYYCSQGAWGMVEYTAEGKMRPHSVVPASCPKWVSITNFVAIIPGKSGVYFSGWNGVVYWDRSPKFHACSPWAIRYSFHL